MPNIVEMIQKDAERIVAENRRVESKTRTAEVQLTAKRIEVRDLEEKIKSLKEKVKDLEKSISAERVQVIATMDKRNSEADVLLASAHAEKKKLARERIDFEENSLKVIAENQKSTKALEILRGKVKKAVDALI